MRRDMDLIRLIAFKIENAECGIDSDDIEIDGYSQSQIAYHCVLMKESQMIDAIDTSTMSTEFSSFFINRLTSIGHDFADAARNEGVWLKTKSTIAAAIGGASVDVVIKCLKAHALSVLGLPPEA